MKLACLLPVLTVACGGAGALAPPPPDHPDAGAPVADAGQATQEPDAAPGCPMVTPFSSFGTTRIASVDLILGLPSVAIAADGRARVFYLGGPADQPLILGADPAGGGARKLSRHGSSFTRPRFLAAPGGELRGAYEAGDGTLRWVEWSGDPTQDPTDVAVTSDIALPAVPAVAMDGQGQPVVAALYDHAVRLATRSGHTWNIETVASNIEVAGATIAMGLDGAGQPVIAAVGDPFGSHDPGADSVRFGVTVWSRTAASWSRSLFDDPNRDVEPHALSTPDGDVAIFFGHDGALAMASQHDGAWRLQAPLLDAGGHALPLVDGGGFDVAYGPGGLLHVVHPLAWPRRGVAYAVYDGCRWTEVVAAASDGADPAIALDASGRPHIVFDTAVASGGDGTAADTTEVWYAFPVP